MIIIGAKLFATFIVQTRLPNTLLDSAIAAELSPFLVMLLIVAIYIVLGCFLEGIGMVLITVQSSCQLSWAMVLTRSGSEYWLLSSSS